MTELFLNARRSVTAPIFALTRKIGAFRKDERGVAAIEAAFCLPLLAGIFLGSLTLWDNMKGHERVTSVTDMVADVMSQGTSIDEGLIETMHAVLVNAVAAQKDDVTLEVVHAYRNDGAPNNKKSRAYTTSYGGLLFCNWRSKLGDVPTKGSKVGRTAPPVASKIPPVGDSDSVIYVTVKVRRRSILAYADAAGTGERIHTASAIVRPRFGPIRKTDSHNSDGAYNQQYGKCDRWMNVS